MKILLIDADSTIPNIALMKLSTFYKTRKHDVTLIKYNIPFFPSRKKHINIVPKEYDKIFCSVIFNNNQQYIKGNNIIFGGAGYNIHSELPDYIENLECDYSIYPENNISYGYITRGCIRNCYFCIVPKKEGYIHKVNNIEDILKHKKIKLLDNNFLAYKEHEKELKHFIDINLKFQFIQGLDIRLINKNNSDLLNKSKYFGDYIFAFDNIKLKNVIKEKLKLLTWIPDWRKKFYVYIHPDMKLSETLNRILFLKSNKCLPYIMRDITCWSSEYSNFYKDIAAYCNQPKMFKNFSFEGFLNIRYTNSKRIEYSNSIYNLTLKEVLNV